MVVGGDPAEWDEEEEGGMVGDDWALETIGGGSKFVNQSCDPGHG